MAGSIALPGQRRVISWAYPKSLTSGSGTCTRACWIPMRASRATVMTLLWCPAEIRLTQAGLVFLRIVP